MGGNHELPVLNPVFIQLYLKGKNYKICCSLYSMAFSFDTIILLAFICLHYV